MEDIDRKYILFLIQYYRKLRFLHISTIFRIYPVLVANTGFGPKNIAILTEYYINRFYPSILDLFLEVDKYTDISE